MSVTVASNDTRAFHDGDWMNLDHRFVSWGFAYGDFKVDALLAVRICDRQCSPSGSPRLQLARCDLIATCVLVAISWLHGYASFMWYSVRSSHGPRGVSYEAPTRSRCSAVPSLRFVLRGALGAEIRKSIRGFQLRFEDSQSCAARRAPVWRSAGGLCRRRRARTDACASGRFFDN